MNHIIVTVLVTAAVMLAGRALHGQTVDPVSVLTPTQHVSHRIDTTLVANNTSPTLPGIIIGWNWASMTRQANRDVHTNLLHWDSPFTGTPPTGTVPPTWWWFEAQTTPSSLVPGTNLILDPKSPIDPSEYPTNYPWYDVLYNLTAENNDLAFSKDFANCLIEGIGIRFQPELDVVPDITTFTPRTGDRQKAIFGFRTRAHGTVPTATTDANFDRFVLSQTGLTAPQMVLAGSWPDDKFGIWPVRQGNPQSSPFNGRQMYLACNLRRVAGTANDTVNDNAVVLRLRVRRLLCGNDPNVPTNWSSVVFDSIPVDRLVDGATQNWIDLPRVLDNTALGADRGRILRCEQVAAATTVNEIVITRRMLPRGTDARPDLTILAHMIFDTEPVFYTQPNDDRVNYRYLRDENTVYADNCTGNKIARLQVEVDYVGNADVAIDWIDLGTDNYTRLMQGHFDRKARDVIDEQLRFLNALNTRPDLDTNHVRVARWFSRDEGKESRWQAMRHFDLLVGGTSQTERGIHGNQARYEYMLEPDVVWDGSTLDMLSSVTVPFARYGYRSLGPVGTDTQMAFCNWEWGIATRDNRNGRSYCMDYDLRWGNHNTATQDLTLPAALTTTSPADAWYPTIYNGTKTDFTSGSLQQRYEYFRWKRSQEADALFGPRPWIANIWLHSEWRTDSIATGSGLKMLNTPHNKDKGWRPQTGEELRLMLWSSLILGSKGFITYWGAGLDSLTDRANYNINNHSRDLGLCSGIPQESGTFRSKAVANALADILHSFSVADSSLGSDFLYTGQLTLTLPAFPGTTFWQFGRRLGLREAFGTAYDTVRTNLGLSTTEEIYVGQQSQRIVLQEAALAVHHNRALLEDLRLKTWYSRGFRSWTKGDSLALASVVDVLASKTRHPERDSVHLRPTWEPQDSSFVEFTLLDIDSVPRSERYVIGVLNRRGNPFDYVKNGPSPIDTLHIDYMATFRPTASHYARVGSSSDKSIRYRQAGSRQISIPFRTGVGTHDPDFVLRIRELGAPANAARGYWPIDTIIGSHDGLTVNFLPGEGKLFEVTRINARTQEQAGHVLHSNQRKMVVFPVAHTTANQATTAADPTWVTGPPNDTAGTATRTYFRMVNGTEVRYHRVYHVSAAVPQVWYQRSIAYPLDHQQSSAVSQTVTLQWETPIFLSGTILRPMGSQGVTTVNGACAAYPSIVVRYNHSFPAGDNAHPPFVQSATGYQPGTSQTPYGRQSVAYIVFAAELGVADPITGNQTVGIVEAQLPADIPRADQELALAANRPRVLAEVNSRPYAGAIGNRSRLWSYGTPVIAAAAGGNYYAWSGFTQGIGIGFKRPGDWYLAANNKQVIPRRTGTGQATHPSLTSYARLWLGEPDVALVWQEGMDAEAGTDILYTRLMLTATGGLRFHLSPSTSPTIQTGVGLLPTVIDSNRAVMSNDASAWYGVSPQSPVVVSYPSIHRHLSDYDITNVNSRWNLGLVNHKADRIWWQASADLWVSGNWPWVSYNRQFLVNRATDGNDHSLRGLSSNVMSSFPSQVVAGDLRVTAPTLMLGGPEVSQGHQETETGPGVPVPTGVWYGDSVTSVRFTIRPTAASPMAATLTYGYDLYGSGLSHALLGGAPLPATTVLHTISTAEIPHAASRYTTARLPMMQLNRGMHTTPFVYNGAYEYLAPTPTIEQQSAAFFKEDATAGPAYTVDSFHGFTDGGGMLTIGRATTGQNGVVAPLPLGPSAAVVDAEASQALGRPVERTVELASTWFTVDGYRQMDMAVLSSGIGPGASVVLEEEFSGRRLPVAMADARSADGTMQAADLQLGLLSGGERRYRLLVGAPTPTAAKVTHMMIGAMPTGEGLGKASEADPARASGRPWRLMNLDDGTELATDAVLGIWPLPAGDAATLVLMPPPGLMPPPVAGEGRQSLEVTVTITAADGRLMHRQQTPSTSILRLDTSTWPSGTYAVVVTGDHGTLANKPLVVLR